MHFLAALFRSSLLIQNSQPKDSVIILTKLSFRYFLKIGNRNVFFRFEFKENRNFSRRFDAKVKVLN